MNIIINVDEKPVNKKHISYSVKLIKDHISLYEIEEVSYIHPDSQGSATISRIEETLIRTYHILDMTASPLILLNHMFNTIKIIYKNKENNNVYN